MSTKIAIYVFTIYKSLIFENSEVKKVSYYTTQILIRAMPIPINEI